ncbi:MAG TPA: nitrilase-related carbon-nitrogen hydrolase [Nitrospiria bacterium]
MRAGFYQFKPEFGEVRKNVEAVVRKLNRVEADLIVLPELFTSGYQFVSKRETAELAEEIPRGDTTRRLIALAKDKKMWLVAGLPEREGRLLYNSAVLVGPRGYAATYRKVHLFYEEKRWFEAGREGFRSYDIGRARIGMMICFDWIYPEAARSLALAGADIICHPSNLVLPYCPEAMVTRCLENHVFAITANRIGTERRGGRKPLTFIGQSEIVDTRGRILCRAPGDREALTIQEINPREARNKAINRYNDLFLDRHKEIYK